MTEPTDPELVVHRRAAGFVQIDNRAVNDDRLSFRARGLLLWLLGRPPGWRYSTHRMPSPTEGRDAVRTAMRELESAGYVRRRRVNGAGGKVTTVTEVAELPELMPPPPGTAQPAPVGPAPAGPAPVSPASQTDRRRLRKEESQDRGLSAGSPARRRRPLRAADVRLRGQGAAPSAEYLAAREAIGRPSRAGEVDVVQRDP